MAKKTTTAKVATGTAGGVVWTARQRARLFGSLHPQAGDPGAPDGDEAWATLRGRYGAPKLAATSDEADRAAEKVLASLRAEFKSARAPSTSTPARESLRIGMLLHEGESAADYDKNRRPSIAALVAFWIGAWGLEFASRVVWTRGRSQGVIYSGDARRTVVLKGGEAEAHAPGCYEPYWLLLRRSILAASPEEYEATRALWESLGVAEYVRAATFCRSPEAAHKLAVKALRRGAAAYGSVVLLSAITDPALALRLACGQPLNYACGAELHAFHVVDNLGAAAAPVLLALLERVMSGGDARRALAAAAVLADAGLCRARLAALEGPARTTLAAALK
ncbi:MAG: hypothetical protein JNL82_10800 [Myxococcales bacterium]|nr:hypothetical protein [Myxococcales bacterium]